MAWHSRNPGGLLIDSQSNRMDSLARRGFAMILVLAGVFMLGDAAAIDGNYVSPYQAQWDSRSGAASLPLETLLGGLLLGFNVLAMLILSIRNRRQTKR